MSYAHSGLKLTVKLLLMVVLCHSAVLCFAAARNGPNSVPRKVPENSVFDKATGLHGHHRCVAAAMAAAKQHSGSHCDLNHLDVSSMLVPERSSTHLRVARWLACHGHSGNTDFLPVHMLDLAAS